MSKKMSREEVEKIAELVNLELSDTEIEKLSTILPETLDYVKVLEELDVSGISETYQVTGLTNVFMKPNGNVATLSKEDALANAREVLEDKFATGAVFDR